MTTHDEDRGQANGPGSSDDAFVTSGNTSSFPFEFSDEVRNFAAGELTENEEQRRRVLYSGAVEWWQHGFRVIPLHHVRDDGSCSCGNSECESQGKHPVELSWQHPRENADADTRWWRLVGSSADTADWEPHANVGVLTGAASGVFVVDIDPGNGGDVTWERLAEEHADEPIPSTLIVRTGSGGRHYYFRWPGHTVINSKPWGKDSGIDIRGDGGQVAAPPSVSAKGAYSFVEKIRDHAQVAVAPGWILDRIKADFNQQLGRPTGNPAAIPDRVITRYVRTAIAGEAAVVRNAPEGDRNNTLNTSAFRLGQLGAHGILTEDEARSALTEAARAVGLGHNETRATISSGWRKGLLAPRDLSDVGALQRAESAPPTLDEFGLGDRLVIYFGDILRWVRDWGEWALYSDGVWRRCPEAEPQRLAQEVIRMLPDTEASWFSEDEMAEDDKDSPRARWFAWYARQRAVSKVSAMVRIARDRPAIRTSADQFDAGAYWLNCKNGIWDGEHGLFVAHDPDQMVTMQSPVAYDPAARCPGWLAFLERVQPDPEVRAYLQRAVGYSATADMGEQIIFLHHGDGANGKSVFHDVLYRILGDYAQSVPVETLTQTRIATGVPTDIARMRGRRYLSASESKEGTKLDEQVIKQLTGGETIAARFMRADFFEFRPVGKIHLTSNHLQHVSDDAATWRRIHLIAWDVVIPPAEREQNLADRLYREEAAGILNWILEGIARWRSERLSPPEGIMRRTEQYRREEDRIERWLDESVEIIASPDAKPVVNCYLRFLFADFKEWCSQTGQPTRMSDRALSAKLRKKGYQDGRDRLGVYFTQLQVRTKIP